MKKKTRILMPLLCILLMLGCNSGDEAARPPVFQGFAYEPSIVTAGDSVFITAVQQTPGRNLYAARHTWTLQLRVDDGGISKDVTLSYSTPKVEGVYRYESSKDNPTWKICIPERTIPGAYTCTFHADWSNAANGETATYNGGTGEGCTGRITSTNATLFSKADGSFTLRVQ